MIVFAHAGHWLAQLLYVAPLIVLVGILLVTKARERHAPEGEKKIEPPAGS